MNFKELGLCPEILQAIEDLGYEDATPIQIKAIPAILKGRDMVGSAQTGTGKTAAFALPALHRLAKPGGCRALALAPTRELAIQIEENFRKYGKYLGLKMALLYGGVKYGKQLEELGNNPDIIVATPGRLLDHIQQGNLSLGKIEILILDEVDRMLDMGFVEDVTKIINKTPRSRQTLLFSATIPDAVVRLSKWALDNPAEAKIDIKISAAETVSHALYPVPAIQKFDLLVSLLNNIKFDSLIIFFQTRRGTDKISHWLTEHGQDVRVLHSDLKQRDRMSALQDFKDGKVKILSATDVASRGLDISNVTHVINYDVPQHAEDYIHRIGRTGRARTEGEAFTLCKPEELPLVESVEKLLGNPLPRKFVDDFAYREAPESLVPTGAVVSKKRNRSFGKQVSFGSRKRR
ncbi:DEAD/DEAH box helicase [Candidatus Seribacter sulfatis]|jgi:ATP-dependent RNA helicase RhlE|uniref:DEAD/DEAH box helicase n=1 Tax=Candidatus Seribacter sulfatis TaxID=3381756 RepID=UPI0031C84C62|nr:DEAD/DEAH box helicase [Opitutae bacterium]MDC1309705.1 DEAD/DEAH box helicase [Opitutales bacterium]